MSLRASSWLFRLPWFLVLSAWLTAPPLATAQSIVLRRPALHWVRSDAALGCVGPRALAERVEALVGPVLVRPSEAEHSIEGQVDVIAEGRLRVRVRVLDAAGHQVGERQFEQTAAECIELTPAIVFVIGMAIDPEVAAHGLPPALLALLGIGDRPPEQALLEELDDKPTPATRPMVQPAPALLVAAPPKPVVLPRFQAAVLLHAGFGEAPRTLLSGEARLLYVVRRPFAIAGYVRSGAQLGAYHFQTTHTLRVAVLDAGVLGCFDPAARWGLRANACLGVELSTAFGSGSGFSRDDQGATTGAGLVVQVTAQRKLWRRWGLMVWLGGRLGVPTRAFVFEDSQMRVNAYDFRSFSVALGLGPTLDF